MDSATKNVHLGEVEERLLQHFDGSGDSTTHTKELAEEAGITRHTAAKYLSVLEARGLVGHDEVGNAKVWYLIGNEVSIRTLHRSDIDELVSVAEQIPGIKDDEDDLRNFRRELQDHLDQSSKFCIGAEADQSLIGFIIGDRSSWEFGRSAAVGWIRILGVRPDYQGRGVGSRLFDELIQRFQTEGVDRIRTIVGWDQSDVLPYFHDQGFRMTESTVLEKELTTKPEP